MDAIDPPEVPLLERLRLAKGVSAGQVVVATGVTHKTLRRYEREPTYYPNAVTVCKLADYYGVSAAEIVRDMRAQVRAKEALEGRDVAA
jgi:transcriptional regulator with XRE-family HTH domain